MNVERRDTLSDSKLAKRKKMLFSHSSVHLSSCACGNSEGEKQPQLVGSRMGPFILLFGRSWVFLSLPGWFISLHGYFFVYFFVFSNDRDIQWWDYIDFFEYFSKEPKFKIVIFGYWNELCIFFYFLFWFEGIIVCCKSVVNKTIYFNM